MDVAVVTFYFLSVVFNVFAAFRDGADDPSWEMRWRFLDLAEQARIATAVDSRKADEELEPEDLALVPGYRRHWRRRNACVDLMPAPFLIVAGALALTGVMELGLFTVGAGLAVAFAGGWNTLQKRRMDGKLRLAVEAEAATASSPA